jgi:hypothetical protein
MTSKIIIPSFLFIAIVIFIAALSRILPHPPNFTPIAAIALFGGSCFKNKKMGFIISLLAMFVSDLIIGFHNTMPYVYVSFILISLIGNQMQSNKKPENIIFYSLISSLLFFMLTNFGVWASGGFEAGMNGLLNTYLIAIPFYESSVFGSFFLNTILGDLFYCGILFGSFQVVKNKFLVFN